MKLPSSAPGARGALLAALFALLTTSPGPWAQAEKKKEEKENPAAELNPLEKKFQETLTGATLAGRWRLVDKGNLGKEAEDKYTISRAVKMGNDYWLIAARVEYGGKDVTVPVPVKVFWAGDTPVISITNAGLPGLGTYSARVLVYEDLYTGTWSGPGHGGFLSGAITRTEAVPTPKEPSEKSPPKNPSEKK